jgi:hypothetical protein
MWELSIACSNKHKDILDYINNCFCADLPDCMLTSFTDKHFTYLLFACDEGIENLCKSKIKRCISTYIIDVHKYNYFIHKILKNKSLIGQAYIKALTLYDTDTDMALINSLVEFKTEFHIDSFITFQLKDLERMWQELCELIMSNINYLNSDMMLDVMRQFISTFDKSINTLKIIIEKEGFVLYKIQNNKNPIKLKDKALDIDVVNYILMTNPNRIEIYGNVGENFSIISLLKSLYDDKVSIIN